MEFFRYRSNAWGQQVLDGVSWDSVWAFVVAGFVFIVIHVVYTSWRGKLRKRNAVDQ